VETAAWAACLQHRAEVHRVSQRQVEVLIPEPEGGVCVGGGVAVSVRHWSVVKRRMMTTSHECLHRTVNTDCFSATQRNAPCVDLDGDPVRRRSLECGTKHKVDDCLVLQAALVRAPIG
jgi:hypothetical protein